MAAQVGAKDWHSSKKIHKRARYLLEHPDEQIPSDVEFLVGSGDGEPKKAFKCHRFMLALVSSMFQAYFYGSFPQEDKVVQLPDITPDAFQNLLNYAYADDFTGLTMDNVLDTLYCAKKYLISKLERACREFIQRQILANEKIDRIWYIYEQARIIDEDNLAAIALAEISRRAGDVFELPDFLLLSTPTLKAILERDNLSAPEPTLYQALLRWIKHNMKDGAASLRESLGSLLYSIRFPLFSAIELADIPAEDRIFVDNEERDLFRCISGTNKPAIPFNTIPRTPSPAPYMCFVDLISHPLTVCRIEITLRPDLAPACCQFLADMIDGGFALNFLAVHNDAPNADATLPVPQAVVQERNVLTRSSRGEVWFEWDGPNGNVYLTAWKKPGVRSSAAFGFVTGFFGKADFEGYVKLCYYNDDVGGHAWIHMGHSSAQNDEAIW